MLPLAFNSEGDPFEPPAAAVGWRVKRYQPGRGAPELVYSSGGLPLVLPLEAGSDELRRAVVTPGKYRLDPVDGHHRVIRDAGSACVVVCERMRPEPPTANAVPRASRPVGTDPNENAMLIESMRLSVEALRINAEIARTVASRFGAMVEAAASLLRAADGAALAGHQPIHAEHDDSEDHKSDDDDNDRQAAVHDDDENAQDAGPPTCPSEMDVSALISQLATVLLGPRQPAPEATPAAAAAPPPSESPASEPSVSAPGNQPQEPPGVATVTTPPPPAGPQPMPPAAASSTRTQPRTASSPSPDAPAFTARPNASASMSSPAVPSQGAHPEAPTATASSPLPSSLATPPLASTTKAPDAAPPPAVPPANANTNAGTAAPRTTQGARRNATAMPASARSSPAKPSPSGAPQVTWVAQAAASSGFSFPTSTAAPPPPTISPPPPTPLSAARRRSSSSAMGAPPVTYGDDIASLFTSTDVEPPPISTDVVLHFVAILRALRRNEAALVGAAAGELSLHDLRTWLEDLSLMTVPEAVAYVRELIAGSNRLRSVS